MKQLTYAHSGIVFLLGGAERGGQLSLFDNVVALTVRAQLCLYANVVAW